MKAAVVFATLLILGRAASAEIADRFPATSWQRADPASQFAFVIPACDLVIIRRGWHHSDPKRTEINRLLRLILDAGPCH
jgi:hypothetical protein